MMSSRAKCLLCYGFKLRAHGAGLPPEETLIISVYSHSERKTKREVRIGRHSIEVLAKWLLDCLFLLDLLMKRKEADITDALRTRRELMREYEYIPDVD
jgi:hypothetical protein